MMRDDMKPGDQVFFYHSNCAVPGIVGIMEVVRESYPDFSAFDPDDKHFDPKATRPIRAGSWLILSSSERCPAPLPCKN